MFELIKSLLNDVWEFLKKIFVKIVSFFQNICSATILVINAATAELLSTGRKSITASRTGTIRS